MLGDSRARVGRAVLLAVLHSGCSGPLGDVGSAQQALTIEDIDLPDPPQGLTTTLTVGSFAELEDAIDTAKTLGKVRINVEGVVAPTSSLSLDGAKPEDILIVADSVTSLGDVYIPGDARRIEFRGGTYRSFAFEAACPHARDVLFTGVTVDADAGSAFEIRGLRVAIIDSTISSPRYSVWVGYDGMCKSEHITIAGSVLSSYYDAGVTFSPESTIRFVGVGWSAVYQNTISNVEKHNYRVHAYSQHNFAEDNILLTSGVMFGTMSGDTLLDQGFENNIFCHTEPDLFNLGTGVQDIEAHGNVAYTDVWTSFPHEGTTEPGWSVSGNSVDAYGDRPLTLCP
jgi:hypothetical protein